ncbi:bifunctional 2-C-methyl-D-erythritol 4-phosphate cytidylyltransferase/2-C-methyl-D-erythritol 2,4-cyclodiphosphate synthase [Campylobacter geochelonis]|uniref:Bifunctional enzyme IspD/IspF n=1 Tax=Campylobacter geochelonis TaxID=1780362 RepID=A0A128EGA3_9BACT|nr:bifunctional 2-C-methyl-D-erythritol 4-phosphate cytidylyltransferase/2-C-methyl-D-erythritol 2,4-cyclodiphosphate synthase [Campylobacter geochelonis]QKF71746.1 bifunctional 2-C-methyl-D-erythritol 4-phosphate cytidylyltransferase / 2-C-methyl-D-erythritol 2,4-cyclodiphosphate synthase protein [Campylobacter geochelonis]CZE47601.1 bifunctional 2-C-methyl-D-erythritol 4-phosphate cytidylyltransferase/2-C-methyl-D-erythritol 2%2C4-cyclodiphosphate synthase protein [Campylobacter geochelonis]CZ
MCEISLVILAAGDSTRMQMSAKKQWLRVGHDPLWKFVADRLKTKYKFSKTIVVANSDELEYMKSYDDSFFYAKGGKSRQESLKNALCFIDSMYVLVHDVARAEISETLLNSIIDKALEFDCVSPYIGVYDTTYLNDKIINRDEIKLIQTPQLSKTSLLKKALLKDEIFTDDSMAVASVGGKLGFVKGESTALKITTKDDLKKLNLAPASSDIFVGNGFDVHKFQAGDGLMLCGIKVPCEYEFIAHSDGDVALHALTDAILGACGLGDIGEFYPDTDAKFKGANSADLLKDALKRVKNFGYEVVNADITIMAQAPKLGTYKKEMAKNVAQILGINRVNVKATTTEKLGFVGRSEGVAVMATASLKYLDWKNL